MPATQRRLLPYVSNLLTEGYLCDYLAARAELDPQREFILLWSLGHDLPGAVTVIPAKGEAWPPSLEDIPSVARSARRKGPLHFSLAGVQLKFSVVKEYGKACGLTVPAAGIGGSWILKLPCSRFGGFPENELAMMTLARLTGIDVPEFRLVETKYIKALPDDLGSLRGRQSYVVRRVDCRENGLIHAEDFAQVFGAYPDDKYKKATARNIAYVLDIQTDAHEVEEFVRRLVFTATIGNADMHSKNWSLIYPDGRTPKMARSCDFLSTIVFVKDDEAALKFERTRRRDRFSPEELSRLAEKARLSPGPFLDTAAETVERFHDVRATEQAHLPLKSEWRNMIDSHLRKLPIVNDLA